MTVIAVVAGTTIAQIASVMGVAIFPVIALKLADELGVPAAIIGYQVSMIFGTATLTSPLMSSLITRYGACRMSQVGLALCALAMSLTLSSNLIAIVLASILVGLGMSVMTPASAHLLFRFSPSRNRNLIFSVKQTGVPLGWLLVALTAPGITLAFGWRWALALVIVIAVSTLAALQLARAHWDDDRKTQALARQPLFAGLRVIWQRAELRWLAMASFCYSFMQLCLNSFLMLMLVAEADYTLVQAGLLLSVVQISGVAGRIGWGWAADHSGSGLAVLLQLNVIMIVCCLLTAFVSPHWPAFALLLLCIAFGGTAVGWNGIFLAEVARHSPPGMVGVATGGAMVWSFGGILIGPALFATVYKWDGSYTATFGWLTVIAVLGLACILAARRAER